MTQVKIAVLSNAGGVGKTTIVRNIGYELQKLKYNVGLIDLDPQHNLDLFCGIPSIKDATQTVLNIFMEGSDSIHFKKISDRESMEVCQGHIGGIEMQASIGELMLKKKLENSPTRHDIILFDCPATLGNFCTEAILAADYILIPVNLEEKSLSGLQGLFDCIKVLSEDFGLNPPKILGIIPNQFNKSKATHRGLAYFLERICSESDLKLLSTIDDSSEVLNATSKGLAMGMHRPWHKCSIAFKQIAAEIVTELKQSELDRTEKIAA